MPAILSKGWYPNLMTEYPLSRFPASRAGQRSTSASLAI